MRVGEKEISEQAEIVDRYRDLFTPEQLDALREAEEARRRRRARAALPAAQDVRGGHRRGRARRARGRAREPPARRARRLSRARRCRCGTPRRSSPCCPATPTARSSARSRPRRARRFNDDRLELLRATARSSRPSSPAIADPVERNEEEKGISLRELARALDAASRASAAAYERLRDRWFERLLGADRDDVPSSTTPPTCAGSRRSRRRTRRSARDRGLPRDARRARLRPREHAEHQARPRRPAAEVAARVRDRERPAEGRAPDHARAGRAPRLPGVPARGGARAPLRRLRPGAAVHVPPDLARPRADGDLLVHRRGDLARARLARRALRPLGRAGARERRGDDASSRRCSSAATRRSCASSSTSGRASPTTAARRTGYEERLTEATGIRYPREDYLSDMDAGFYSADYLRAWIRSAQLRAPPGRRGRRGLVAQRRRRASCCASSSARARSRRARRSRRGSASTRSTRSPLLHEIGAR